MIAETKNKLQIAIKKRDYIFHDRPGNTDVWRLIHDEGDGFLNVTVDLLGNCLLVEQHKESANTDALLKNLIDHYGVNKPIFFKKRWSNSKEDRSGSQVSGPPFHSEFQVVERGLKFNLKICNEEHIGLFLDSRPARQRVEEESKDKRVLNLFCYTGGFGMAASRGGARSTTNVDNKRSALDIAKQNYIVNNLQFNTRSFLKSDVTKFLHNANKNKGRFDFVIIDPPPRFSRKNKSDFNPKTGYVGLLRKCFSLLEDEGVFLIGLNALFVTDSEFEEIVKEALSLSKKHLKNIENIEAGEDFPPTKNRPTARFYLGKIK